MKTPTEKQYRCLLVLGSAGVVLTPGRRDWEPLLRHGWVEPASEREEDARWLAPLRITADGYRALAAGRERYGAPELTGEMREQLLISEPPYIAKLRRDLDEARSERDRLQRRVPVLERRLASVRRAVQEADAA